ncbi:universal stress protein [Halopiger djelfimassiliensis]|uniref:universal stress protein n=1 Tax=Halopiger djelfimassiliensis TaxID=1293047 RepID=UPI0006781F88|nr:universal stress protein [Halopiger djelfimassiliensis]
MSEFRHRVLVPVEILRGESVPDSLVETFASVPVVLLGYHEIPEQTAPAQARLQFEEKARDELDDLVAAFEAAGGDVTSRLVFTHDPLKSFERVAIERGCDSVLVLNPAPVLEDVFVPVRSDVNVDHIARLVGRVVAGTDAAVTLFHVASTEGGKRLGRTVLDRAARTLTAPDDGGVPADRIDRLVLVDDSPREAILDYADDYDLVVLGENRPSIRSMIFGGTAEVVAKRAVCPVLVVRRQFLERDGGTDDTGTESR